MSAAGSNIGVFCEIRVLKDAALSDIASLRADIEAAFVGMTIPIGERIVDSVMASSDRIRETVAESVSAGFSEGVASGAASMGGALAVLGTRAAFHESDIAYAGGMNASGYYQGIGARQLPNYSTVGGMGGNVGGDEYPFEGEVMGAPLLLGGPPGAAGMGGAEAVGETGEGALDAGTFGAAGAAAGMGYFGPFMALMAVRRLAQQANEYVKENREIDFTENPTAQNLGIVGGISMGTVEAKLALSQFQAEHTGGLSTPVSWIENQAVSLAKDIPNIDRAAGIPLLGDIQKISHLDSPEMQESALREAVRTSESADRDAEKKKQEESLHRELDLDRQIYEARQHGNEEQVKYIELLAKEQETKQRMNDAQPDAFLGDQWFNTFGKQELTRLTEQQTGMDALTATESAQSGFDVNTMAGISLRRAQGDTGLANRLEFEQRHLEKREKASNDIVELQARHAPQSEIDAAQSRLNALDTSWPMEISAFNAGITGGTKDIEERTRELNLETSGNAIEARREGIQYATDKAAQAAEDGSPEGTARAAAIRAEGQAEMAHLGSGIRAESPMQAWMGLQHAIPGMPHAGGELPAGVHPGSRTAHDLQVQHDLASGALQHNEERQRLIDHSREVGAAQHQLALGQDQHGRNWHWRNDFGPHDLTGANPQPFPSPSPPPHHQLTPYRAGLGIGGGPYDPEGQAEEDQVRIQIQKEYGGWRYDSEGHRIQGGPTTQMSRAAQDLSDAAKSLKNSTLKAVIVHPN